MNEPGPQNPAGGRAPVSPLELFRANLGPRPGATALVTARGGFSFQQIYDQARGLASVLKGRDLGPGAVVALYLEDYQQFLSSLLAVWLAGATALPMNLSLPASVLRRMEEQTGCVLAIAAAEPEDSGLPLVRPDERGGEGGREDSPAAPQGDQLGMIMFTSGTTGVPKAIPCTHAMMAGNHWLMSEILELEPSQRLLVNVPCYYTSAICHLFTCFAKGASLAAFPGFLFASQLAAHIEAHGCTGLGGAPTHIGRLLDAARAGGAPQGLSWVMSSGDHLSGQAMRDLAETLPEVRLFNVYGLSEVAGRLCVLRPSEARDKSGSAGRPLPGMSLSIRDEDGSELPPGKVGEVYVQGPLLMKGYLGLESVNRELMTPLGFRSGDFGYRDSDGFLFLQGRKDDIFKSGGEKVSTMLIQEALAGRAEFSDVAVLAESNPMMGKVPVVYYVPAPGRAFDRGGLISDLRVMLPANHLPRFFHPVPAIPRTGSGKVVRRDLEKMK